jgi:hypothetical protein
VTAPTTWPKLSEQLPGPRAPRICQACATEASPPRWWEECDERDQPTGVLVILCPQCSNRLVEKHPRLYRRIDWPSPRPGAMEICVACTFRRELACQHPDLKANGGPGLSIQIPQPIRGFRCIRGGRGGEFRMYPHEPRECAGRQVVEVLA